MNFSFNRGRTSRTAAILLLSVRSESSTRTSSDARGSHSVTRRRSSSRLLFFCHSFSFGCHSNVGLLPHTLPFPDLRNHATSTEGVSSDRELPAPPPFSCLLSTLPVVMWTSPILYSPSASESARWTMNRSPSLGSFSSSLLSSSHAVTDSRLCAALRFFLLWCLWPTRFTASGLRSSGCCSLASFCSLASSSP